MGAHPVKEAHLRQLLAVPPKEDRELARFVAREVLGRKGAEEAFLELVERGYPLEAAWRLAALGTAVAFSEREGTFDLWRERVRQGLSIMEALASRGANPSWPLSEADTPLVSGGGNFLHALFHRPSLVDEHLPGYPGYVEVFKEVVRRAVGMGVDPEARDHRGNAPLHKAVLAPPEVVALLAQLVGDIDVQNHLGRTPLHLAPYDIQALLIRLGASTEVRDRFGLTPLMHAVLTGSLWSARELVGGGADVNARDARGYPLLILAQKEEYREKGDWTPLLLEWGADARATDPKGRNVLHHLAPLVPKEGEKALWKWAFLVKAGADPGLPDRNGITPTELLLRFLLRRLATEGAQGPVASSLLPALKGFAPFLHGESAARFFRGLGDGRIARGTAKRLPLLLRARFARELAGILHACREGEGEGAGAPPRGGA